MPRELKNTTNRKYVPLKSMENYSLFSIQASNSPFISPVSDLQQCFNEMISKERDGG